MLEDVVMIDLLGLSYSDPLRRGMCPPSSVEDHCSLHSPAPSQSPLFCHLAGPWNAPMSLQACNSSSEPSLRTTYMSSPPLTLPRTWPLFWNGLYQPPCLLSPVPILPTVKQWGVTPLFCFCPAGLGVSCLTSLELVSSSVK